MQRTVNYKSYCCLYQQFESQHKIQPSLIVAFNCGFSEYAHCNKNSVEAIAETIEDCLSINAELKSTKSSSCNNTWFEGLSKLLLNFNTPIIFTSFTKLEANFDYGYLLSVAQQQQTFQIALKRLLDITKNPYRDLRPLRNWQLSNEDEIYYRNGYIQAVCSYLKR